MATESRPSRFGVGPRIFLPSLLYAALAGLATHFWPDACLIRPAGQIFFFAGLLLVALGLPLWIFAIVSVMKAYRQDRLVTSGAFALCRHPVYAAWILLIGPGLTLMSRSWPLMLTPLVGYAIFKLLIRTEDEYLERRFDGAYLAYRKRVHELLPIPRF